MIPLLFGYLLGAASWAILSSWLAPIFGWPVLFLGLFLCSVAFLYIVAKTPTPEDDR
jgi:sugar phosphate permease